MKSFKITKERHDYLLPVFGKTGTNQLLEKRVNGIDQYFFIGTEEEYLDLLNRCKYL